MTWTQADFVKRWNERMSDPKRDERVGQAAFNTLVEFDAALAELIVGTNNDPFYKDDVVPDFLREVFG
ncbi:MAG: hypothetical protein ACO38Q_04595 [Aquiluna sp.]